MAEGVRVSTQIVSGSRDLDKKVGIVSHQNTSRVIEKRLRDNPEKKVNRKSRKNTLYLKYLKKE